MKKFLTVLIFTLLLVGCNAAQDTNERKGDEPKVEIEKDQQLKMQLLKADEENGVTLEEEMYQQLSGLLEANGEIGEADDFSVHAINIVEKGNGEAVLLYLGINRLEKGIKNITLNYTLGVKNSDGTVDYVLDAEEVDLDEKFVGVIKPNHAIPFTIPVTPEGKEVLQKMTEENKVLKLENPDYELVD